MRYLSFGPQSQTEYPVCLLVPQIMKDEIERAYITPFSMDPNALLVIDLHQAEGKKKTPAAEQKAYIEDELLSVLNDCKVKYLIIADADYFKTFTKQSQAEKNLGYIVDTFYGNFKAIYVPNYRQIFYDPDKVKAKIAQGINALKTHIEGSYTPPGNEIIKFEAYPDTDEGKETWLEILLEMNCPLAIDIEAFSLKHNSSGIGTITFCWNKHEGVAFAVDYVPIKGATEPPYGIQVRNERLRKALKEFFIKLNQTAIYHSISFDVYILIYQLFMEDILDTEGLLEGLQVMLKNWDCTKIITYLATNSCAGNKLGLKDNAQEFSGNYAVDEIEDITKIPLDKLLTYNLIDGLSTWYVHNKYYDRMVADDQLDIYQNLFQPATWDIIQMQLTGMPINMDRVKEVRAIMDADEAQAIAQMKASPIIQKFTYQLNEEWVDAKNATLKVKRVTIADAKEDFNPNSAPQLQKLLYDMLGLPILSRTDSGLPSTDGDTLKALRHHAGDQELITLLDALSDYKAVNKLTTSFLPAMEAAVQGPDGWHYLFGNFNLGGTISGRLSSSKPNLQNLPSNGKSDKQRAYAKLIKTCFEAPPGWLFCGLDFDSLEDKISGLTTKDPNKLKVYTDGYDGHSLRAFSYFREQMPDILQSEGRRVFKIEQNGETTYLFEGDLVMLPNGQTAPIEDAHSMV